MILSLLPEAYLYFRRKEVYMMYNKPVVVIINLRDTEDIIAYARCSGADRTKGCS